LCSVGGRVAELKVLVSHRRAELIVANIASN